MALLTWARYKTITGDTTTSQATVEAAIADALAYLEGEIGRTLESAQHTERLLVHYSSAFQGGRVYPTFTPVTVAADHDIVSTHVLAGATSDASPFFQDSEIYATVTYTGGYVERVANPSAANKLPAHVEQDLAWAAYALTHQSTSSIPVGAKSVRVGDASIQYDKPASPRLSSNFTWSKATMRLKRRFV